MSRRILRQDVPVLVDFDNVVPMSTLADIRAIGHAYHVREALDLLVRACEKTIPALDGRFRSVRFDVRLYGGWHSDVREGGNFAIRDGFPVSVPTEVGRLLSDVLQTQRRSYGSHIVEFELVSRLLCAEDFPLETTLRRGPLSFKPVEWSRQTSCPFDASGCKELESLKSWVAGRCPKRGTCRSKARNLGLQLHQKMVDVMLATDLITYCVAKGVPHVVLVCMDDDLLPALLLSCRESNTQIIVVRIGKRHPGYYDQSLRAEARLSIVDLDATSMETRHEP